MKLLVVFTVLFFVHAIHAKRSSSCSSSQFDCLNGQCIPISWECDGFQDCSNGYDETYCGTYIYSTTYPPYTNGPTDPPTTYGPTDPPTTYGPTDLPYTNTIGPSETPHYTTYPPLSTEASVPPATTDEIVTTTSPSGSDCSLPFYLIGNRCLYFEVFLTGTYGEMNYRCAQLGGKPISITDANDLHSIVKFIGNNDLNGSLWLEGYKPSGNGTYAWRSTGQPVKLGTPFWASIYSSSGDYGQEPVPYQDERCIFLNKSRNYYFDTAGCTDNDYGVICEK